MRVEAENNLVVLQKFALFSKTEIVRQFSPKKFLGIANIWTIFATFFAKTNFREIFQNRRNFEKFYHFRANRKRHFCFIPSTDH